MANQNIKSLYTVIMIFLFISSLEYSQTVEVSRIDKLKNTISNKELKLKGEIKIWQKRKSQRESRPKRLCAKSQKRKLRKRKRDMKTVQSCREENSHFC